MSSNITQTIRLMLNCGIKYEKMTTMLICVCFQYEDLEGARYDLEMIRSHFRYDACVAVVDFEYEVRRKFMSTTLLLNKSSVKDLCDAAAEIGVFVDKVILYFSGHGKKNGFLWHDGSLTNVISLAERIFPGEDKLVIVDSCNANGYDLRYQYRGNDNWSYVNTSSLTTGDMMCIHATSVGVKTESSSLQGSSLTRLLTSSRSQHSSLIEVIESSKLVNHNVDVSSSSPLRIAWLSRFSVRCVS